MLGIVLVVLLAAAAAGDDNLSASKSTGATYDEATEEYEVTNVGIAKQAHGDDEVVLSRAAPSGRVLNSRT